MNFDLYEVGGPLRGVGRLGVNYVIAWFLTINHYFETFFRLANLG